MQFFVARAPKYKSVKESLPFHYCVELNAYFNSGFGFLYHQINLIYFQFNFLLNKEMQKYKKKSLIFKRTRSEAVKTDGTAVSIISKTIIAESLTHLVILTWDIRFLLSPTLAILPNWTVFFLVSLNHVKSLKKKKGYIRCLIMQHTTSMKKTPIKIVFLRITWGTP